MDQVNATILKTTIEAIPTLTEENFSSWRTRITALFKLGGRTTIPLSAQLFFRSSQPRPKAMLLLPRTRIMHNSFGRLSLSASYPRNPRIELFITDVRSAIVKMQDVGIKLEEDIITNDLLRRLPSSLDNIKQSTTHSPNGEDIKPESLLDHLEIHLNELKVSAESKGEIIGTTMFTSEEQRCTPGQHNPFSKTHTRDKCWSLYPKKRVTFLKRKDESQVSNFSTFSSLQPFVFILDSGSSSHMVSDRHFFSSLDETESGVINTSCGMNTLEIKGKGTIQSHLSSAELLHKSLGHVSYCQLHRKLGIPIKASETCKSCAVVKITKATFTHRSSSASKPFEELHLDLIGPITPLSHRHDKYILTIVDSNTRFVAAIPMTSKSEVFSTLTYAINVEAKRLGYYPSVLHSDRGTKFTNRELGPLSSHFERSCVLCLNQIPTDRSKKSPYELFKGVSIPLTFFKPMGNPVAVLSNTKNSKLEPRGDFGKLIGLNAELKSYRIRLDNGQVINSKNVNFLDFLCEPISSPDYGELIIEKEAMTQNCVKAPNPETNEEEAVSVKEEEDTEESFPRHDIEDEDSSSNDEAVADQLIPTSEPAVEGSKRTAPYLKLIKSLYGLKQAPKNWYQTLTGWFGEIDYRPSVSDACLFIHKEKTSFIFFHVDDLIVVGEPDAFEKLFLSRFPNSTAHSPDTLIVKTPLTPAVQLHTATDEDHAAFQNLNINYRSFTGVLNYLACRTRPDLAAAVSILSQFNQKPGLSHWQEVLHCWKYLKGTSTLGLLLKPCPEKKKNRINFFTDATWAEDQETRISRSGSLAFWKSCPLMWNSKKQRNITMSSTESEMNALSDGEQENQWLTYLIEELWKTELAPTLFHINNKGLLEKLKNFGSNSKTKHLDIKIKGLREKFKNDEIAVKLISSNDMLADSLTKAAPLSSIRKLQDSCLKVL
ncbi:hypothetical protein VP01_3399g1 [Puccinia sorghi]|uniref:Integrase catalytic domain-containing protein n=1 Tax=Puccinia sorghi TaxID=27349 RepID=A0A0L6UWL7_9BASI|nr:hypothetical protein VP01_3399g1 [Puccinia sorghi]